MCRFATSCSQAYTNHMLGFHSGQASAVAALNIPADQPMMRKLYCECGFFSLYGNQLGEATNHLVVPCLLVLLIVFFLTSVFSFSATLTFWSCCTIPSAIFSLSLRLLPIPSIVPVATRYSIFSVLITWLKKTGLQFSSIEKALR